MSTKKIIRNILLIFALTLTLFASSCANNKSIDDKKDNSVIVDNSTDGDEKDNSAIVDNTTDEDDKDISEDIHATLIDYYSNVGRVIELDKVYIISIQPYESGYLVLSMYEGEGPQLLLSMVEKEGNNFTITKITDGDFTISNGFSVNRVIDNDKTIVFGELNKTRWTPLMEYAERTDYRRIEIVFDRDTYTSELEPGQRGYIVVMNEEVTITDLLLYNSDNVVSDSLMELIEFSITVNERNFYE